MEGSDNGYSTGLENRNPARDLWVRVPPPPPIETSRFERVAPRGRAAAALRKMVCRFAANWLAGQKSKTV
ncbi:MAG: hypothetical protein CEN90_290 [Parcubacteria group bacterium Licking1014_17]|nr:MAG: hypothetical protein CEN90_290 [Parcubacteria group bacterium Licking1014_17]